MVMLGNIVSALNETPIHSEAGSLPNYLDLSTSIHRDVIRLQVTIRKKFSLQGGNWHDAFTSEIFL